MNIGAIGVQELDAIQMGEIMGGVIVAGPNVVPEVVVETVIAVVDWFCENVDASAAKAGGMTIR